ncbi:MAG: pseudouridine synthase [Prochlorotrichaceae cyanobacterium]
MAPERLQKVLAHHGLGSRREVERWIEAGRVVVNGELAYLGQKINPSSDRIEIDGKPLSLKTEIPKLYILLNKPKGVVSTCSDPRQRRTVLDLLPLDLREGTGIHPVGRLDSDSTGALLLTNDGDVTFQLTHPRHNILKTYRVWVEGYLQPQTLAQWQEGVSLVDDTGKTYQTLPAVVEVLQEEKKQTCLRIQMQEGRNRQIRRIAEQLGHPVLRLHRLAIGEIQLGDLASGCWRKLPYHRIERLLRSKRGVKNRG